MSFAKLEQEILVYCYGSPTSYQILLQCTRKHHPSFSTEMVEDTTKNMLNVLMNLDLIRDVNTSSLFETTQAGEKHAETLLIQNNMDEYLRFA